MVLVYLWNFFQKILYFKCIRESPTSPGSPTNPWDGICGDGRDLPNPEDKAKVPETDLVHGPEGLEPVPVGALEPARLVPGVEKLLLGLDPRVVQVGEGDAHHAHRARHVVREVDALGDLLGRGE